MRGCYLALALALALGLALALTPALALALALAPAPALTLTRVAALLHRYETEELPYEDGSFRSDLWRRQEAACYAAAEAVPQLAPHCHARAEALCWELFRAGYTRAQAGTIVH